MSKNKSLVDNSSQFYSMANEQDCLEQDLAKDMIKNTYQINFGNKKEKFSLNDLIFKLERPTKDEFPNEMQCIVCDRELKKNHKHCC